MSGLYVRVEQNGALTKKRLTMKSAEFWREGFAQQLPTYDRSVKKTGEMRRLNSVRTETLKIPLKHAGFDVKSAITSVNTIAGFGKNSLSYFLSALACAGFRVHETAGEAKAEIYLNKGGRLIIDPVADELAAVTEGAAGKNHIVKFLTTQPPRGKNAEWKESVLKNWLAKNVFGNPGNANGISFIETMTTFLMANAEGWGGESAVTPALRSAALLHALGRQESAQSVLDAIGELDDQKYLPLSWCEKDVAAIKVEALKTGFVEIGLSHAAACSGLDPVNGKPTDFFAGLLGRFVSLPSNYTGLSALLNLNGGIGYFSETDIKVIAEQYGISESHLDRLREICEIAQQIKSNLSREFGDPHDCRQQVGAGIDSFSKLYFPRLVEIKEQLQAIQPLFESVDLPANIGDVALERLFWGQGISAQNLKDRWAGASRQVDDSICMTETLLGVPGNFKLHNEFLDEYENSLDSLRVLARILRQVMNNHDSILKDAEGAKNAGNPVKAKELELLHGSIAFAPELVSAVGFKTGKEKKAAFEREQDENGDGVSVERSASFYLLELPRLRSEYEDFEEHYANTTAGFAEAKKQSDVLLQKLTGGQSLATRMLALYRRQNERQYAVRGIEYDSDLLEINARRQWLQEYFGIWRQLSHEARSLARTKMTGMDLKVNPAVSWPKLCHEFLLEGKASFYYKMYAKTRHEPIELDNVKLMALDLDALMVEMLDTLDAATYERHEVDEIGVRSRLLEIAARSLDAPVSLDVLGVDKWPLKITMRPVEESYLVLSRPLEPAEAARLVSRMAVSLRNAAALLGRERHTGSLTLKPTKNINAIHYFPKITDKHGEPRVWMVPARIMKAKAGAIDALMLVAKEDEGEIRDTWVVQELFDRLQQLICSTKTSPAQIKSIRILLAEMPHTWGCSMGLGGIKMLPGHQNVLPEQGLTISKQEVSRFKNTDKAPAFPLVAQVKHLNLLDDVLRGERVIAPNNYTLRYYFVKDGAGAVVPVVHSVELHIALQTASLIDEENDDNSQNPYFNRLVGIDLGERGIGFCVRDLTQPGTPVVERGMVPIPAIKKFIDATTRYRNKHQKQMAIKRSFIDYGEMVKAVSGNVIHAVKVLMHHYKALPVLERDVEDKQLGQVYQRVISAFSFQNVSTVDDLRRHFWRGDQCIHPFMAIQFEEKTKKGVKVIKKSFHLFPGTLVHAAGTSQECSGCGVNANKLVKNSNQTSFVTNEHGRVVIDGVTMQLFDTRSMNHVNESGVRSPYPVSAERKFTKETLGSQIKQQRRVAPIGQSKDTSQSVFWCPNVDCKHHHPDRLLHSDVNSADNIVMKKIRSLVPA